MTLLAASLIDAALVLAVALAATAALRRRSAALRHAILAAAIVAAALMPVLELLLPQHAVIRWTDASAVMSSELTLTSGDTISGRIDEAAAGAAAGVPWPTALALVWLAGAVVTAAALMTSLARLIRLRARCTPITDGRRQLTDDLSRQCGLRRRVRLLQSDAPTLLVTCGVLRPRIILPAGASAWTGDRTRVVLLHELAHIRRHDALSQITGEALRVVHWPNPLVWAACRRLRQESEHACDDAVLGEGVGATEYAGHLLDVAKALSARHSTWASAAAIAHPSTLERRIVAMLQSHRNRAPLSRRGWMAAALAALAVSLPIAAAGVAPEEQTVIVPAAAPDVRLDDPTAEAGIAGASRVDAPRPRAQAPVAPAASRSSASSPVRQATSSVAGTVLDPSGGTLPGARVTLTGTQMGSPLTAIADASGRFEFRNLVAGQYELVVQLVGFATVTDVVAVAPGASAQHTITLPLGRVEETITVVCSAGAATLAERLQRLARSVSDGVFPVVSAQVPIRVGGNLRPPKKIRDVKPVCPTTPQGAAKITLNGVIGADGIVSLLETAGSAADAGVAAFAEAATVAVRQWLFTPTLLNGDPVEVDITVTVVFRK